MKTTITFLTLFFGVLVFSSFLQPNTSRIFIHSGKIDNSNYQLNIIGAKILPLKDTIFGRNQCLITRCPLTLTNNTDDALTYTVMSASWWDDYALDNKDFSFAEDYWNVFKNGPEKHVLPPHQSVTRYIKIITYKNYYRGEKLKIAMRLKKVVNTPIAGAITAGSSDSNLLIWSNEVTIH